MSERTVITTIQITDIHKGIHKDSEFDKKSWGEETGEMVKSALCADDVVVTNVQEFIGGAE